MRSVAVGESQSRAYHCLSAIHHDGDKERLSERERRNKATQEEKEEEGEEEQEERTTRQ